MINSKNNLDNLFEEMIKKSLITTSNGWIEKAIQQKNQRLPVGIASSMVLTFDHLDRRLLNMIKPN
jgi:hypothetical protein